jgi:hypothetical protein
MCARVHKCASVPSRLTRSRRCPAIRALRQRVRDCGTTLTLHYLRIRWRIATVALVVAHPIMHTRSHINKRSHTHTHTSTRQHATPVTSPTQHQRQSTAASVTASGAGRRCHLYVAHHMHRHMHHHHIRRHDQHTPAPNAHASENSSLGIVDINATRLTPTATLGVRGTALAAGVGGSRLVVVDGAGSVASRRVIVDVAIVACHATHHLQAQRNAMRARTHTTTYTHLRREESAAIRQKRVPSQRLQRWATIGIALAAPACGKNSR